MPEVDKIVHLLRLRGPTRSGDVASELRMSRATLSRRVREIRSDLIVLGRGRATRLALRHPDRRRPFPLYEVPETGLPMNLGGLVPTRSGEWFLEAENPPSMLLHDDFRDGLFPGWPWFLEDLRPSGFLGRAFGRRVAKLLGYPPDPGQWTDLQIAEALSRFGANLPGCFILGEMAFDESQRVRIAADNRTRTTDTSKEYPLRAEEALGEQEDIGSSAAGEQPKFTTTIQEADDSTPREVLVKFSPPVNTPSGRRWADLLRAEFYAAQVLADHGFQTARTRILEAGGRAFLESTRFDRTGNMGRRGVVSLRALDAAFVGSASENWAASARALEAAELIHSSDREKIIRLHCFGELIGNSDMHFGNISFFLAERFPLPLCPVYDMLPMYFRPTSAGEIRRANLAPNLPRPENETAWRETWPVAYEYWKRVSRSAEISRAFRQIARESIRTVERLRQLSG
jgi:hypothetical protein